MSPKRMLYGPHDPLRARRARPSGLSLAAAATAILLGISGVSLAQAEELEPVATTDATTQSETAEPTEEPAGETPTPTPEPTLEPTPTPTPEPTPTPTPEPTPTPTPEPTPTPTPEPTPTPTPTPEPTPTPTPEPTPTPTPTPDPTQPPTTTPSEPGPAPAGPNGVSASGRQVTLSGDGPVARIVSTKADPQVSALLGARTAVDRALASLRDAEAELKSALSTREVARSIATRLQGIADEARADADVAARVFFAASQGDGATTSSLDAVFGAGNDLLAGLGGVARVSQIAGDAEALEKVAAKRAAEADAAEQRAQAAWQAVDAVPVADYEADIQTAELAVSAARQEQTGLQTRLAAASVALVDSLPRDSGQLSEQGWASPVTGRITDGYGPRPNKPLAGVNEFHRGTDVAASCRGPVFAATAGIVRAAGPNGSYGNWILLDHGAGVSTGYAHLIDGGVLVAAGEAVEAGQLIGAVGSTGASTGCHLHFEVRLDGVAVDAVPFMAARGISLG
jgi:murein DD-endopeptidase MepM/ murein hydrolase activator NlpD